MKTTNNVATGHGITLNSDNVKKFATRLKKTLKEENIDFKTSKCYDILAKTLGSSNWHELSQHLSSNNAINYEHKESKNVVDTTNAVKLNSIFDLPWVEFKYIVSKITDYLNFDFHTKEFLEILLDIVHTNQPKSEIYWDKINEFLDNSERNFRTDVEGVAVADYTICLNPSLNESERKILIDRVIKCGGGGYYYRAKFSPEKIESFFYMLRFIKEENFLLRDKHTIFAASDVLQFENGRYKSEYEFVNALIKLADINNQSLNYNKNAYRTLSFHDLIIQLFSRTNMLSHITEDSETLLAKYTKYIAEDLFKNHKFISYLCGNMKKYIHNTISFSVQDKNLGNNNSVSKECILNYKFNFIPHFAIFKHEIDNLNLSNLPHGLINKNEIVNNIIVEIIFNNNDNIYYEKYKQVFLDKIQEKDFLSNSDINIALSY